MNILKLTPFLFLSVLGMSQARLVLNNNAYMVISGGAKVVVENSNANAITTSGTGGNIISEAEANQVIWNIGSSTGTYTVPWTTKTTLKKIPMTINITGAGNAGGKFALSTYETTTDNNTPYPTIPTAMTSMNGGIPSTDRSLKVVDRFWILDNTSYTTKPSATLSFNYDNAVNEIGASNSLVEANLRAQRWNPTIMPNSGWQNILLGTSQFPTPVVNGINVTPADFWSIWTLVDLNFPLPVELISQEVENIRCENKISWKVADEKNCSYYEINRSYDGYNWEKISVTPSQGKSGVLDYSFRDNSFASNGIIYYQINQVDLNGTVNPFETLSVNAFCEENSGPSIYPNPMQNELKVQSAKSGVLTLLDGVGKIVLEVELSPSLNTIDVSHLATGMYTTRVMINSQEYIQKVVKSQY